MSNQKFILHSKTVVSALLTLFIAIAPKIQDGIKSKMTVKLGLEIAAIALTSAGTIVSRYVASSSLYTPHGLPGRNYISSTDSISETKDH